MDPTLFNNYVTQLIFLIKNTPNVTTTKLITIQDRALPEFTKAFQHMEKEGLMTIENGSDLKLTDKGLALLPETAQDNNRLDTQCGDCEGRGYSPKEHETLTLLNSILKRRPAALEKYDQWYMLGDHALFRANFIQDRNDLAGKSILFIGDDDLVSIAVALTRLPEKVVMLEVDERLVNFVNEIAKEYNLNLEGHVYDIRLPLNEKFASNFDVFLCDPTETAEGFKLFVSRGVSGLKGVGSAVYFGLTSLEASKEKWYQLQLLLHKMNLVLTDIRRNFTEYPDPGWEENLPIWQTLKQKPTQTWYRSALYRLEAIDTPNPLVKGVCEAPEEVYVDDESWATTSTKTQVDLTGAK